MPFLPAQRILIIAGTVCLLSLCAGGAHAQQQEPTPIKVDFSDLFEYVIEKGQSVQKLIGSVELRQDSVFMFCDTALIYNELDVLALGRVIIQQGDSVSVFSDSLFYRGAERIADLTGEVILINGAQKLFTTNLEYDLNTRIATYEQGGLFTNDTSQLSSKRGLYDVAANMIYFKDSVIIVDPNFELRTDTLAYNTETQTALFQAPTLITHDSSRIYCEGGYYDIGNRIALFSGNPQYSKGETKAVADEMRYEGKEKKMTLLGNALFEEPGRRAQAEQITYLEETEEILLSGRARYESENQIIMAEHFDYVKADGLGLAQGDVIWQDTSAGISIYCERANYRKEGDYLKAFGGRNDRPLLIYRVDEDSLYMTADTLIAERIDGENADTIRQFSAFNQVRIFKSNLQALCDSLSYSSADSLIRLYDQPILWSDTSQFSADTIHIQLSEEGVQRIDLLEQSLIVSTPDLTYFNQIKGKYIQAFLEDDEIRRMVVEGNAETIYYAQEEDGTYLGANQTSCSEMLFLFAEKKLQQIKFYREPSGRFIPMEQAVNEELRLPGFRWDFERRPQSVDDLFE